MNEQMTKHQREDHHMSGMATDAHGVEWHGINEQSAKRSPEIASELEILTKATMRLQEVAGALEARLRPVMAPLAVQEGISEVPQDSLTPLGGDLRDARNALLHTADLLAGFLDRLEV